MKMKYANLLIAAGLLSSAVIASAERIAILPFTSDDAAAPGWDVASELFSRWNGGASMVLVDWDSLTNMLDGERPEPEKLQDPAFLRRVGGLVSVDEVVSGTYSQEGDRALVSAKMVDVATGQERRAQRILTRAAAKPEFKIDENETAAMRDAVSDSPCAGAARRVHRLERIMLDVKAKYWASELRKDRVAKGSKFTATAVIADPALKKEFISKLARWSSRKRIPELTYREAQELADGETEALSLARRCNIIP